ncbi:interleukin-17 receptor C [Numida meleagris]|uniref:interleukin-17 receptor C n=1 Tax=Numida meleagris TaxID=8996 RepID=UPI000B3DAF6D|nr:interleukin-17 receptor C [Numida meleagris]
MKDGPCAQTVRRGRPQGATLAQLLHASARARPAGPMRGRAGQSGAEQGRPHPGAVPGARERSRKRESAVVAAAGPVGWEWGCGAGAMGCPGPTRITLGWLLLLLVLAAGGHGALDDTVACSKGLACRLLDADVLCGMEPVALGPGLALLRLRLEPALRCVGQGTCSPCLQARLRLGLEPEDGDGDMGTAASPQRNVTALLLLSGHGYASSRCVAMEVRASSVPPGRHLGSVQFRCFEAPLGSELHITAYSNARGRRRLSQRQRVPDCSWPAAQAAILQCKVPRLQVSLGLTAVLVEVQVATVGLNYTLRLYHNHNHGTGGSGRVVTASGPMNYSVPLEEVLPCLCLQVWPEIQDPLRATLCPFSNDAAAWERLWVQTQLVLHDVGQALTCSISAPCDLPAELVPCWSPAPAALCQALPGLQQPITGQGPQEFQALQPHPNLCVQVRSSGKVRLTQCLRDHEHPGALSGHTDDILLMESGGNASLCALQQGNCTPLASFTTMLYHPQGAGRPGLLEQQLQEDVASGQCVQLWRHENGSGVTLWACPMHKYMRARWALAWLGVLLCAACILLLLLLKKEDVKGWLKSLRAGCGSKAPLRGRRALLLHAAEPVAERAACVLTAALRSVGMAVVAAPGGGSGMAAWGPLPWLHALHRRALRGGDAIVLLLSPAAEAAARRWEDAAGGVSRAGDTSGGPSPLHDPGHEVEPCEAFAAALSCAIPVLSAGTGCYVVARLEPTVTSVPQVLQAAPAFVLPSEAVGFLQALAGRRACRLEPHAAAVAERLRRALRE